MQAESKNTLNTANQRNDDNIDGYQKQKHDTDASSSTKNVRVVGRIRPLAQYEIENGSKPCVIKVPNILNDDGPETLQINEGEKRWFELDAILDSDSTQREVYEKSGARKAISEDIFQGFNCTILAYGQTGAGGLIVGSVDSWVCGSLYFAVRYRCVSAQYWTSYIRKGDKLTISWTSPIGHADWPFLYGLNQSNS
jgi:hypothetical protein